MDGFVLLHFTDFTFFFFNDTATTEIYTLSLHDALPIWAGEGFERGARGNYQALHGGPREHHRGGFLSHPGAQDRKSTRLNSSHSQISYAVFCLKKKKHLLYGRAIDHVMPLAQTDLDQFP